MKDNYRDRDGSFQGQPDSGIPGGGFSLGGPAGSGTSSNGVSWSRLEEVGDLHYHASAYSSALDYYRQLLDEPLLMAMGTEQAVRVLRKSIDASILLGNLQQVDLLLEKSEILFSPDRSDIDEHELAVARAVFQIRRAIVLRERGRLHEALDLAKRSFSVLALTDEHKDVARLQVVMGICQLRLGHLEKAEEFFHDGLSTFRRIGHDLGVANLLNNLALLQKIRCRWDQALGLMEKAVELANRIGSSHLLPGFYLNQGIILQKVGRLGESRALLDKGHRLARSLGDKMRQTRLCLAMGRLETLDGRLARAEELILEGKNLADQNRLLRESTIADEYLGDILLARGEYEKAQFNYQLGLEKAQAIATGNDLEGELQRRVGQAHLMAGDLEEAVAVSHVAIAVCEGCGEDYEIGFCHATLGKAYSGLSDLQQADHHFREAISVFHQQRLTHLWVEAILDFARFRRPSAGEAELLLIRRFLMDAQENGASSVSDKALCEVLNQLAVVQIDLGQHDDALLTVFEMERHARGIDDLELQSRVVELRNRIESGLLGGMEKAENHLQAISSLPGLFSRTDASVPRNLDAVLKAGMDRVGADAGFIAMADDSGLADNLRIEARQGLTENLGGQLTHWFDRECVAGRISGTSFYSRLDLDDPIVAAVPALLTVAESCVFMPISLHGRQFGLLFLGRSSSQEGSSGFDRASLDFLATYMGFLALFLYEKGRGKGDHHEPTPMESIESFENIITQNAKMLEVLGLARKVAPSDLTVLLNGETGTGKGLLAYSIHALSKRSDQRFLSINCAAIPETLLESELFGHKRGSFTGANSDKTGLLAEAEGGTVFLDEIGKMSFNMQGKLLHFMDTKTVRPVGSNVEFKVDVRVICASKSDLHEMASRGEFLEDLYYRLLDFPLVIPPMRERPDDIELLARHFITRFSQDLDVPVPEMDGVFLDLLLRHGWAGNVRELEKALRRAIVLAQGDGVLRAEHLPQDIAGSVDQVVPDGAITPLKETLAGVECREIRRALRSCGGNKSQVARDLKISYPNLLKKIRHYGLGA